MAKLCYHVKCSNAPRLLREITRLGVGFSSLKKQGEHLSFIIRKQDSKILENALVERFLEYEKTEKKTVFEDLFSLSRIGVFLGVFSVLILYVVSSFFVLFTDVSEVHGMGREEIEKHLQDLGVKPFCIKSKINCEEIEKDLIKNYPFSVVEVSVVGVTLLVKTKAELPPPTYEDTLKQGAIVSIEDSIVTRIVHLDGTCKVRVGDSVKQGQVLISNSILVGEKTVPSRALGEVYGRVWRQREIFIPKTVISFQDTGEVKRLYKQNFSKNCSLPESPFSFFRVEHSYVLFSPFLPVYHHTFTFYATTPITANNPDYEDISKCVEKVKREMEGEILGEEGEVLRSWEVVREEDSGKFITVVCEIEKRIDVYE